MDQKIMNEIINLIEKHKKGTDILAIFCKQLSDRIDHLEKRLEQLEKELGDDQTKGGLKN